VALEREQTSILQMRGTEVAALSQDECVSRSSPNANILLGYYNICQQIYRINWERFSSYLKAVATGSPHEFYSDPGRNRLGRTDIRKACWPAFSDFTAVIKPSPVFHTQTWSLWLLCA